VRRTEARASRWAAVLGLGLLLAACGGDEGGGDAGGGGGGGGGGGNNSPTIGGSPDTQVMESTAYSFEPNAQDADGDALTFSIQNLPSWASFDEATGAMTGTPGPGDVGLYANIRISVSDGEASTNLAAFSVQVVSTAAGSAMLSWTAPTENTDGSALTDLSGFKIYWGTAPGNYPNSVELDIGTMSYVVEQLTPDTYYFVATALDSEGHESAFSNMASKTVL
jgi:hypothetical protein